jgi:hypothetical protein
MADDFSVADGIPDRLVRHAHRIKCAPIRWQESWESRDLAFRLG